MRAMMIYPDGHTAIVEIGCENVYGLPAYGIDDLGKQNDLKSIIGRFRIVAAHDEFEMLDLRLKRDKPWNPVASMMYGYAQSNRTLYGAVLVAEWDGEYVLGLSDIGLQLLQASVEALMGQYLDMWWRG